MSLQVDALKDLNQKQFGKQEKSPSHNNIIFQIVTVHLKMPISSHVMICYSHIIGKIIVTVFLDSNFHMYRFQVPSLKLHCKALTTVSVYEPSRWCPPKPRLKAIWKARKSSICNNILFQIWIEWKVSAQWCQAQVWSDAVVH